LGSALPQTLKYTSIEEASEQNDLVELGGIREIIMIKKFKSLLWQKENFLYVDAYLGKAINHLPK